MIKFKLESSNTEPGVDTNWVPNTVDGHASIKAGVEGVVFRNGSTMSVAVKAEDPEFSDEELVNLVALSSKCWHHLAFMAGLNIGSPRLGVASAGGFVSQLANPWAALKRGLEENDSFSVFDALDSPHLGTGAVLVGRDRVVTFRLFRDVQGPVGVMAAAWRLANMAEWTRKFTQELRLTSDTKLKWETFNAITTHISRGIEPPTRARRVDENGQAQRPSMEQLLGRRIRPTPVQRRPGAALAPARSLSVQDLVDGQEYRLRTGRAGDTGPDWGVWRRVPLHVERSGGEVTSLTVVESGVDWASYNPRRDFSPPQAEEAARQSMTSYSPHGLFLAEDYYMEVEGVVCLRWPVSAVSATSTAGGASE